MGTEVLMFVLTAFDRPPREYHWEERVSTRQVKDFEKGTPNYDSGTYTECEIEKALTFFSRKKGLDTVFISFNLAHDAAILF
jgi:hypothetical protein